MAMVQTPLPPDQDQDQRQDLDLPFYPYGYSGGPEEEPFTGAGMAAAASGYYDSPPLEHRPVTPINMAARVLQGPTPIHAESLAAPRRARRYYSGYQPQTTPEQPSYARFRSVSSEPLYPPEAYRVYDPQVQAPGHSGQLEAPVQAPLQAPAQGQGQGQDHLYMSEPSASSPSPPQTGPIPKPKETAKTSASDILVSEDREGVVWIKFEYTRNRVKWMYNIRCDVATVDASELSHEFKLQNCVYPKAMAPNYQSNRAKYETECNQLGWRLAHLNSDLRGKRGLIQRAVDSYRNSSGDLSVRSRRVRKLARSKTEKR